MTIIDLAVLSKETFTISEQRESHTIELDFKKISVSVFKSMFFNSSGSFCINSVPILFDFQKINEDTLNLYDSILTFAVEDLNTTPSAITPASKIQLRKELYGLSLQDLSINSSVTYASVEAYIIVDNTFIISAVFINKNCCIKPVIIKFNYIIDESTV